VFIVGANDRFPRRAILLALFLLVGYLARELEPWKLIAISSVFVFALFELSCYYYNIIVLLGPLAMLQRRHAMTLLGISAISEIASLSIGWFDELYVVDSLLFGGVLVYIIIDLVLQQRRSVTAADVAEKSQTQAA
jgi:hypothetical protein